MSFLLKNVPPQKLLFFRKVFSVQFTHFFFILFHTVLHVNQAKPIVNRLQECIGSYLSKRNPILNLESKQVHLVSFFQRTTHQKVIPKNILGEVQGIAQEWVLHEKASRAWKTQPKEIPRDRRDCHVQQACQVVHQESEVTLKEYENLITFQLDLYLPWHKNLPKSCRIFHSYCRRLYPVGIACFPRVTVENYPKQSADEETQCAFHELGIKQ